MRRKARWPAGLSPKWSGPWHRASMKRPVMWRRAMPSTQSANSVLLLWSTSSSNIPPSGACTPILTRKASEQSRIGQLGSPVWTSAQKAPTPLSSAAAPSAWTSRRPTMCRSLSTPEKPMLNSSTSMPSPLSSLPCMMTCKTPVVGTSPLVSLGKRSSMSCLCSSDGTTSFNEAARPGVTPPPPLRCKNMPSSAAPFVICSCESSSRTTS
mmetsp:Transcript_48710/g.150424  ORF Transcript_48710/g.150424 Transcript_48710/m.150424 type:complete len:210 (-) Transcript_48710:65-694(-)